MFADKQLVNCDYLYLNMKCDKCIADSDSILFTFSHVKALAIVTTAVILRRCGERGCEWYYCRGLNYNTAVTVSFTFYQQIP